MRLKYLLIGLGAGLIALVWWIYKRSRFDAEPAPYTVLRRDKPFELRCYPSLLVATTPIRGDNDEAFMRLFRFIDRDNAGGEKIAMTTPVFFDGQPGAQEKMSLVMPQKTARAGVPAPSSGAVTLDKRPAQPVAVYRFSRGAHARSANGRPSSDSAHGWYRKVCNRLANQPSLTTTHRSFQDFSDGMRP